MIAITVYKKKPYPVSAQKIKHSVIKTFKDNGIVSDAEASVAVVDEETIAGLAKKYLIEEDSDSKSHPVLSFPVGEVKGRFAFPPENIIHLGEIIISYPHAQEESKRTGRLVEDIVCDLASHGALHLVGIHH